MGRYIRNLLGGMAQAIDLAPSPRAYQIDTQGCATDAKKLRGDFKALGNDMRKALKREQTDSRAR